MTNGKNASLNMIKQLYVVKCLLPFTKTVKENNTTLFSIKLRFLTVEDYNNRFAQHTELHI